MLTYCNPTARAAFISSVARQEAELGRELTEREWTAQFDAFHATVVADYEAQRTVSAQSV